jgi:hypothetical protein
MTPAATRVTRLIQEPIQGEISLKAKARFRSS